MTQKFGSFLVLLQGGQSVKYRPDIPGNWTSLCIILDSWPERSHFLLQRAPLSHDKRRASTELQLGTANTLFGASGDRRLLQDSVLWVDDLSPHELWSRVTCLPAFEQVFLTSLDSLGIDYATSLLNGRLTAGLRITSKDQLFLFDKLKDKIEPWHRVTIAISNDLEKEDTCDEKIELDTWLKATQIDDLSFSPISPISLAGLPVAYFVVENDSWFQTGDPVLSLPAIAAESFKRRIYAAAMEMGWAVYESRLDQEVISQYVWHRQIVNWKEPV